MTEFNCLFKNEKGIELCNNITTVEYNTKCLGATGYIDNLKPTDLVFDNNSVVKFIDNFERSAISVLYNVSCPDQIEENNQFAVTAFQRYSNREYWVFGGHYSKYQVTDPGTFNQTWFQNLIETGSENKTLCRTFDDSSCVSCSVNIIDRSAIPGECLSLADEVAQ